MDRGRTETRHGRRWNRREVLLAGSSATVLGSCAAAAAPVPDPTRANPLAARINLYTVVTPDLRASIAFYRDVMGCYELEREGRLGPSLPSVPGVGSGERRYALLRGVDSPRGIRLLEAPRNARPNRPHPGSEPWDPGFGIIEAGTRDFQESYARLTAAGIRTISPPMYYFFRNVEPMNGAVRGTGSIDVRSYAGFGPAGEEFYVTCFVGEPPRPWPAKGLHTPFANTVLAMLDRQPVWNFYGRAFGVLPTSDIECAQQSTNVLIGGPPDLRFRWGGLGDGVSIEWDAYQRPSGTVYATQLDRSGHAMFTVTVRDLGEVRERLQAAGLRPIGAGHLPTVEAVGTEGLYLRGAVGELMEVVERA